jgi:Protein of unknown function (DUF3127).
MSDSSKITGKVHEILPLETFGSGFQKQSLIIETIGNYPQFVNLEFTKDKIDLLDPYKVGDNVTVSYNINGRRWESPQGEVKYFNSIIAWRIESAEGSVSTKNVTATPDEAFGSKNVFAEDESDDLPFN